MHKIRRNRKYAWLACQVCGLVLLSVAPRLQAQVALVVESTRKSLDTPAALVAYSDLVADAISVTLQGSKLNLARTKGYRFVLLQKDPVPAIVLESKLADKALYRILYREDLSEKKVTDKITRSTGRIMKNGVDIGAGRKTTHTVVHFLAGEVTLEFQKWDGAAYQQVARWSGRVGENRGTWSGEAAGQGERFDSSYTSKFAKITDPPKLESLLWKGFAQMDIVPGKLDKKTAIIEYTVKVTNISPWPLQNLEFELRQEYQTSINNEMKSDRSFKPQQRPAPVLLPGESLNVPASIKLIDPKRIGDASIIGAAFNLDIR